MYFIDMQIVYVMDRSNHGPFFLFIPENTHVFSESGSEIELTVYECIKTISQNHISYAGTSQMCRA